MGDVKFSNHGTVVYLDCQDMIMSNGSAFGKTSISDGNLEWFQEVMGSDLMEFDEIFGDEYSGCSRINNSGGFDSFQTSFGNKCHWNAKFLLFTNSLYVLLHWKILTLYQSSTSKILGKMMSFNRIFVVFFYLFLAHQDLLLLLILLPTLSGPMTMLMTVEAKPLLHMLSTCLFIKAVHVHGIIILMLGFRVWMEVAIVLARGEGDGSITSVNIAVNLHDGCNILIKVIRNGFHHMNCLDEAGL
jgi:hypothetical protein